MNGEGGKGEIVHAWTHTGGRETDEKNGGRGKRDVQTRSEKKKKTLLKKGGNELTPSHGHDR